ncbi:Very-long-chain 3-oxoacyl-CoA reductase [Fusarium keratoplasticum]|uniref:Very-long-chain 3-oxoacyl-CoA reductase n=1 Tax=Fusarium keratoplasticum TaxID=1328300 RepID=A0ACC0QNL0_9HYPO|nr:Very-long-chain 3-oxoacyl-CoA reductase [Fusarium keratoplasticum]KAI8660388.1 Very-long-chain 3-oxoacyl-CoA reductase [Fusarium keratoplasticum]KAI8661414.1 Very-long-chain 3-oxoacyl-CoA reductase [Fusarium keratoplasticum]
MDAISDFFQRVPQPLQWSLAGIGALVLGSKLLSYLQLVLSAFVLGGTNLRKYGKPGTWAVVTGASDGLGKEYALQLAAKGFNLVLVSRTLSKLESLAAEIQEKFPGKGLEIKSLAMDFSQNNDADYERLAELIQGLDVGILINNVGQSHSIPVSFLETAKEELQNIITINCIGTLRVTQTVAPILKQRKRGLILTMGSFGGWTPTPYLATYSGSKAFLQQWSNALSSELADDNVDVYLVLSHLVTTAMSKVRRPSLLVPNARNFVKAALGKVGLGGYQTAPNTYTPWWSHAFMLWLIENVPGVNSPITIYYNKKMHVDIRRRALRKAAREAKKQ